MVILKDGSGTPILPGAGLAWLEGILTVVTKLLVELVQIGRVEVHRIEESHDRGRYRRRAAGRRTRSPGVGLVVVRLVLDADDVLIARHRLRIERHGPHVGLTLFLGPIDASRIGALVTQC